MHSTSSTLSGLSEKSPAATYAHSILGTYGTFQTAAGRVDFLETKARLEKAGLSNEFRLTSFLTPVREALPVSGMSFNQLLQRDLDDHRVAVDLIPYLLEPNNAGPAFFPPIVAVLLPFHGDDPMDNFPELSPFNISTDDTGVQWRRTECPPFYRVDRLAYKNGDLHNEIKAGKLEWNSERAKLIVIDGQHRAMALIGIDRTINNKWGNGKGEKYRSFYEGPVNACLEKLTEDQRKALFESIELPVTLIWFPELKESHQVAARKVFVDLNKNARPPSESRVLLLSDTNLTSVFTRSTLNAFRSDGTSFPIYAVEYDHPEHEQASQSKWSVISNVTVIADCIRRLIEGPSKFYAMNSSFGGNESDAQRGEMLRSSLEVASVLPSTIVEEDASYEREKIDSRNFPRSAIKILESQYLDNWGKLITHFFSMLKPYRCHANALLQLKDGWTTASAASGLARDAIFEGVGIYWTLRSSDAYRQEIIRQAQLFQQSIPPKTDVHEAWRIIQEKREEFKKARATAFLGSASKVLASEAAYSMFSTAACQLGFMLAARALEAKLKLSITQVPVFCEKVVEAANSALSAGRELIFVKDPSVTPKNRFNLLSNLDTPRAIYFRYMWMELLSTPEGRCVLESIGAAAPIDELVSTGRHHYRSYLIEDFKKSLRKQHPENSEEKLIKEATKTADKQLSAALKHWFKVNPAEYETWATAPQSTEENLSTAISGDDLEIEVGETIESDKSTTTKSDDLNNLLYDLESDE